MRLHEHTGTWQGDCGFRLMPTDLLDRRPSRAQAAVEADGHGWSLRYTWEHPVDGEQAGTILLGTPDEEGTIAAGWVDSWHQKPELRLLTGQVVQEVVTLHMEYSGWGWTIALHPEGESLRMEMCNVIPEGVRGAERVPYVVMDARWTRPGGLNR